MKKSKVTRYGAYGVIIKDFRLLLILKKSGPYKGLWDLPGGAIEFSETPEAALVREIQEETALRADQIELLAVLSHCSQYFEINETYEFHHIGIIYRVKSFYPLPFLEPEEKECWMEISDIDPEQLTPLAKQALLQIM